MHRWYRESTSAAALAMVPSGRTALSRMGWNAASKEESCLRYMLCCFAIEAGESADARA